MSAVQETAESGQVPPEQLAPDAAGAIRFLERWMDGSEPRSLLVSIVPDSPTTHGHTFDLPGDDAMAQWIERSNRVAGVYWAVNACKPDLTKKAGKPTSSGCSASGPTWTRSRGVTWRGSATGFTGWPEN